MEFVTIEDCIRFHGHLCGGVTLGYVMAKYAMDKIGARPGDPLYCLTEFQNCMTDAVQCVTGCTTGKGNLAVRPIGKRALTLVHKDTGKGVRVTAEFSFPEGMSREESARLVLEADPNTVCKAEKAELIVPAKKKASYGNCDVCGEEFDLTCAIQVGDKCCCPDCAEKLNQEK